MSFDLLMFYLLATTAVLSGLMMVTVKNPIKAALWLVLAFLSTAGVWLIAQAEFLGLVLILVYVGAVMVLFLFVVMMLDINLAVIKEGFTRYLFLGIVATIAVFSLMYLVIGPEKFGLQNYPQPTGALSNFSNTEALAVPLYTVHAYAFVLAAVLLLVGIVAAITLTLRRRATTEVLYQDIDKQIKTQAKDRFKMVNMPVTQSEPEILEEEKDE